MLELFEIIISMNMGRFSGYKWGFGVSDNILH